jgi:hypothetical protein
MNRGLTLLVFLLTMLVRGALAYETETHRALSGAAVDSSVLASPDGSMVDLGLKGITDTSQTFPDSSGEPKIVRDLIRDGARFEDNFPRPRNHFYDPVNNRPLTILGFPVGSTSPDWAIDGTGDPDTTKFSFKAAREYMFKALTDPSESFRRKQFGLLFQSLGQVIHHPQDMAQPQHVRNDPHLDNLSLFGLDNINPFANPSAYEKWTDINDVRDALPFAGYSPTYPSSDPTTFNTARKLWHTPDGKGIADFTNRNFVSAGTNFDKPGLFPTPDFNNVTSTSSDIQQLCAGAQPACNNPGLTGTMFFFGNTVVDLYTGALENNPRASTLSVFDADLQKAGKPFIFTLNRFNFTAAHSFLVPRAVGYSAGMINYFFRGKIDYVPDTDPANPGGFLIRNLGPEDMSGTFGLYYDTQDGTRKAVLDRQGNAVVWDTQTQIQGPLAANTGQMSVTPNFNQPADAKTLNTYMLVFNGTMGTETPENGNKGAVVAKAIQNPYSGALYVAGLDAANQLKFFKVDKNGVSSLQPLEVNPLEYVSAGQWLPERPYHFKQATFTTGPNGVLLHKTVAIVFKRDIFSPPSDISYTLNPATGALRAIAGINWIAQSPDPAVGTFQFILNGINSFVQQPFLSYTRRFVDAQGNTSQTTGAFLLPVAPAGSTFYNNFSKGIMFVSPDGTTFYPRGGTSLHPPGLRITLGVVPSAEFIDLHQGSSSFTSNPFNETGTVTGECVVNYIAANPAGGPNPFFPATARSDRVHVERVDVDTTSASSEFVIVDFVRGELLSYEVRSTSRNFSSSVTDSCVVAALDFSNNPTAQAKVNVQFNSQAQRINTIVGEVILPKGGFQSVIDTSGVIPGTTSVDCGVASGPVAFANVPALGGNLASINYSYEGFAPCPSQTITVFSGVDTGTPKQGIYRALTDRAVDAVYTDVGVAKFQNKTLPNALGGHLFVADVSPIGEVFLATPDLSLIVHKPNGGNMPVLNRDMIPNGIVKLLAAVWM